MTQMTETVVPLDCPTVLRPGKLSVLCFLWVAV